MSALRIEGAMRTRRCMRAAYTRTPRLASPAPTACHIVELRVAIAAFHARAALTGGVSWCGNITDRLAPHEGWH
jgi:hypothetical protein